MFHRNALEAIVLSIAWGTQSVLGPILWLLLVAGFERCLASLPAFISEIYPLYQLQIYLPRTPSLPYPSSAHKISMAPSCCS